MNIFMCVGYFYFHIPEGNEADSCRREVDRTVWIAKERFRFRTVMVDFV
jgi:hypothetical protein